MAPPHSRMRASQPALSCACLLMVLAAAGLTAEETWRGKPPAEWTQQEAEQLLNDSPWARRVEVYQVSGRILGSLPDGSKVVYQDDTALPPRMYSVPVDKLEPEVLRAVYAVRWSSAAIVQQALRRLEDLSSVYAAMQAPPPEVSSEHYVLTARVVVPPTESSMERMQRPPLVDESGFPVRDQPVVLPDLFFGLNENELRGRAELRLPDGVRLKAERALRHGVGTSEGVTFFFPRQQQGRATVAPGTASMEFVFTGSKGNTLKARFRPAAMRAGDQPDL